jgi:hypothetical protein
LKGSESLGFLPCSSGPFCVFEQRGTRGDTADVQGPDFGRPRHALELEPIQLRPEVVRAEVPATMRALTLMDAGKGELDVLAMASTRWVRARCWAWPEEPSEASQCSGNYLHLTDATARTFL